VAKEVSDVNETPVLIAYHGSDHGRTVIEEAAAVLGPRRAIVLVVEPTLTVAESYAVMSSGVPGDELEDLNQSEAVSHAREGAELARKAGFTAEARGTVSPTVWNGIVDVADEVDASVIVVGTCGLTGIRERADGNVSHDVAERAHRPVLVVPSRAPAG
jgi:nucleotide-binding universal stress UspA family protein